MIYPNFRKKYGPPINNRKVSKSTIEKYQDLLPDSLIQLWKEDGFAGYINGMIRTIDPDNVIHYVPKYLELRYNAIPILRTAFGDLIVLSKSTRETSVKMIDIRHQEWVSIASGFPILFEKVFCHEKRLKRVTRSEEFSHIYNTLGPLKSDECYGYFPLLSMGGKECIDNLKVVKFAEYLDSITKTLKDYID